MAYLGVMLVASIQTSGLRTSSFEWLHLRTQRRQSSGYVATISLILIGAAVMEGTRPKERGTSVRPYIKN